MLTGVSDRDISTAMLSAITALEGLLPLLPPNAVLVHVIGPTLSPDGLHTVPTVPVQLLLAPDVHTLASPQLLNRVAGLLLQARVSVMISHDYSALWYCFLSGSRFHVMCGTRCREQSGFASRAIWAKTIT